MISFVTGGGGGGGGHFSITNEKHTFADNSRVEPSIFFMEKVSFSLKLFSGHFYG